MIANYKGLAVYLLCALALQKSENNDIWPFLHFTSQLSTIGFDSFSKEKLGQEIHKYLRSGLAGVGAFLTVKSTS